jgi:hypothetical protein
LSFEFQVLNQIGDGDMPNIELEGVIENGEPKLTASVPSPDHTKVSVVISDLRHEPSAHLVSPRLAHPEQVVDFQMEVSEDLNKASV